ncbi:MAG: hypothetical protein H6719_32525 [Sandaracinaceae bacterium]|nr:hypothetical protein [Sandaracinaceae bacterium]
MRRSSTWPLLLLCLSVGCDDPPPPPEPPPPPPPPPGPIVAGRAIANDGAFALIPSPEGARLFWGAPHREGGGVRTVGLSPTGAALGADRAVAAHGAAAGGTAEQHVSQAVELDAYAVGRRIGLAWVVDYGHHLEAQATWSTDDGEHFGPVEDIGDTVRLEDRARGRVTVSGNDDGRLVVHHRVLDAPCVATEGSCAMFSRTGLGAPDGRQGTDEVRWPCEPLVAASMFRAGTWYHTVCHVEGGGPSTTVESVRPEISFAGPTSFAGCTPEAIAPLDDGALVLTRCGDAWAGHHLDTMGHVRASLRPLERIVACEEGRPVLRARAGRREAKLQLGPAIARIEALLPEDIAAPGARAIWTGEAVLVATPQQRSLSVRRYECLPDGRFDRTDAR